MLSSATPKKRLTTFTAVVLASAFAFLFAGQAASAEGSADPGTSRSLVGASRSSAGVGSLAPNSGLDHMARAQAARMVAKDMIYHNPSLESDADAEGVKWTLIGENVGVGEDVQAVHNAFMASSGHRANVVHADYNAIGVGVATGKDGSVFVAHVFARVEAAASQPAPVVAPTQAPATVAPVAVAAAVATPSGSLAAPKAAAPAAAPVAPADPTDPNALINGIVND